MMGEAERQEGWGFSGVPGRESSEGGELGEPRRFPSHVSRGSAHASRLSLAVLTGWARWGHGLTVPGRWQAASPSFFLCWSFLRKKSCLMFRPLDNLFLHLDSLLNIISCSFKVTQGR